jgi:hypothetical protein
MLSYTNWTYISEMMSCGVETELSLLEDNINGLPNINWNDTFTSNN